MSDLKIKSISDIRLITVLGQSTDELRERVISFWKKEGVVPPVVMESRSKELVLIATNAKNEIIGVSTAAKTQAKLLNNNWFYQYRCYIKPDYRVVGFDTHLTRESLKVLEAFAKSETTEAPIGVLVVVENPNLSNNKINNAAVWRSYKMYFMGFNTKGQPIRVYYFKGARI